MRIWHDPGHGGRDTGCVAGGIVEKDAVLEIARDVSAACAFFGHHNKVSRDADRNLGLAEAAQMASDWGAELALVYHIDALEGAPHIGGLKCYTLDTDLGYQVAYAINRCAPAGLVRSSLDPIKLGGRLWTQAVDNCLRPYLERGIPAVLVEEGFATNPHDVEILTQPRSRPALIAAHLAGVSRAVELTHGLMCV